MGRPVRGYDEDDDDEISILVRCEEEIFPW
jgi:hypothetical protein